MRGTIANIGAVLLFGLMVLLLILEYRPNDERLKKAVNIYIWVFFGVSMVYILFSLRDLDSLFDCVLRFIYLIPMIILLQKKESKENKTIQTILRCLMFAAILFFGALLIWVFFLK